jgi:CheY-like chemotaxis protein
VALRCLLVDDSSRFLHAARILLEEEGLRVVATASTEAEAVRAVAEFRPEVTLVDVDLGQESGFDVVLRLVEDPDLDPGQVILISGHAEEDLADLVAASPALGFVDKSQLSAATVRRLLDDSGGAAKGSPSPAAR